MNEWQFLYGAWKRPHKTLRVHRAKYTQCIYVECHKFKLLKKKYIKKEVKTSKDIYTNKVQIAPAYLPPPESAVIRSS